MSNVWSRARDLLRDKKDSSPGTAVVETPAPPKDSTSFAENQNEFAVALYKQLCGETGNLFLSPYSVRVVMAMLYAGARGETAAEMSGALRFPPSEERLNQGFFDLAQRLEAGDKPYELSVANSLWGQKGTAIISEYLALIERFYEGGFNRVDFRFAAEAVRKKINQWVEDKTRSRIRDLIPPGGLDADTRLVLANAVYFKGMWMHPFNEFMTDNFPFYLEDGGIVEAPLMDQQAEVPYRKASDFQAVDLDYQGDDLSMLILLPKEKDGLRDLEAKLNAGMLNSCVAKMKTRIVDIKLPRYKMTWGSVDLGRPLAELGMPRAFNLDHADFAGINGYEPPHEDSLYVSAVFHKAFVEVNEEGTEAAAATAGVVKAMKSMPLFRPPPPPVFRADHPFLFAIRDRKSGVILFLGRVTNPTVEN